MNSLARLATKPEAADRKPFRQAGETALAALGECLFSPASSCNGRGAAGSFSTRPWRKVRTIASSVRMRFWVEAGLAALCGFLGILTLFTRDWIEVLTRFDPDNNNGSVDDRRRTVSRLHPVVHRRARRSAPPERNRARRNLTTTVKA